MFRAYPGCHFKEHIKNQRRKRRLRRQRKSTAHGPHNYPATLSHKEKHSFFYLHPTEFGLLTFTFLSDITWAVFSYLKLDLRFKETDDFKSQAIAQQVYNLCTVVIALPIVAFAMSKMYDESKMRSLITASITAFASVCTVFLWNYTALGGQLLFQKAGLSERAAAFAASIFPGIAEGPIQAVALLLGHILFQPNFLFNRSEFILSLIVGILPGDVWKLFFEAMSGVAKWNVGGIVLASLTIAVADLLVGFGAMRIVTESVEHLERKKIRTQQAAQSRGGQLVITLQRVGGSHFHSNANSLGNNQSDVSHQAAANDPNAPSRIKAAATILQKGLGFLYRKIWKGEQVGQATQQNQGVRNTL